MEELLKTRCTKGSLIIRPNEVTIELKSLGVHNVQKLNIDEITGVEIKTVFASLFGIGGAASVTIYGRSDQKLVAKMVKLKDAKKAEELVSGLTKGRRKQPMR